MTLIEVWNSSDKCVFRGERLGDFPLNDSDRLVVVEDKKPIDK